MNYELAIVSYTFCFICFAYVWLYPKLKAYDINSLSLYDLVVSLTTLTVGGFLFGGKEISFNLYFIDTTWYWYSIVIYLIIEIPFVLWYLYKHKII